MNLERLAEKNINKVPSMEDEQHMEDCKDYTCFSSSISRLNEMQRPHIDRSFSYRTYVKENSATWQTRRELYVAHYNGTCQHPDCGKQRKPLQLHHVTYKRLGVEALEDVVLVCKICHRQIEWEKSQN